ncbi:MAG: AMP-binding protein [Betaproteobacteria bacterium]|nr:AMP-binding protein [Betaproteobacteria bacterium]
MVGDFVNTVALRSRLDAGMSLRELLAQVRRTLLDALEAQDCPFPRVVEALHPARDPGRSPLFETMFVLQNFERLRALAPMLMPTASAGSVDFGGLRLRQFALAQQLGQFVLTLEVIDIAGPLALHFKYDADLFDESTIARLAGHLRNVLEGIVADPGGTLGGFALLSGAERLALIEGAGAVVGSDGPAWTLPERFEEQVRRSPEAIALSFAGTQLSYAELNRRANRLAHRLREAGVGREALVGLCCEPSIDLVVGLVAIVKAGGAYVPIDLAYPPDRVAFMLADAKVRVLVTQRGLEARLPGYDGVAIVVDEVLADRPDTDPAPCNAPDDLAYVIYTSGSTGRPKGSDAGASRGAAPLHRHAALVRLRARRRVDPVPLRRLRFLGLGTVGRTALRWPARRRAAGDDARPGRVPAVAGGRARDRAQPDPVGLRPAHAGGRRHRRRAADEPALRDFRRGSARASNVADLVRPARRREAAAGQHVRHHRDMRSRHLPAYWPRGPRRRPGQRDRRAHRRPARARPRRRPGAHAARRDGRDVRRRPGPRARDTSSGPTSLRRVSCRTPSFPASGSTAPGTWHGGGRRGSSSTSGASICR